jgi:bacterioferritin-associated ferredoxin
LTISDEVDNARDRALKPQVAIDRQTMTVGGQCGGCGELIGSWLGKAYGRCKCDPDLGRKPKWWEC